MDPTPLMPGAGKGLFDYLPETERTVADREVGRDLEAPRSIGAGRKNRAVAGAELFARLNGRGAGEPLPRGERACLIAIAQQHLDRLHFCKTNPI
jgi:hypothetical protein